MKRPVYITASGLLCARGASPSKVSEALWSGECQHGERLISGKKFPYFHLPLEINGWLPRAKAAIESIRLQLGKLAPETPLFIASSSFQMGYFEELGSQGAGSKVDLPLPAASFSRNLADWLQLSGPRYSFSNACISGFSAIDAARSLISAGQIDEAIVLGVELSNASTLAGFAGMELLSRTSCRPFDTRRDGLVLGEGISAIRLSAEHGAWRIAGLRTGIDAYSMTGPNPNGVPLASATVDCLKEAKMDASDIDLIKLHAAGSPGTDLAEANALRSVFGNRMPPLLSLKAALGHTLGASGIIETAALLACLSDEKTPATYGFSKVDPEIALFPMVDRSTDYVEHALLNLIGFGGGIASLIVSRG